MIKPVLCVLYFIFSLTTAVLTEEDKFTQDDVLPFELARKAGPSNFHHRGATKCPPGATGSFHYPADCKRFLSCWKGRGYVQICAPGTLFNPHTKECDHPSKVKCMDEEGYQNEEGQVATPLGYVRFPGERPPIARHPPKSHQKYQRDDDDDSEASNEDQRRYTGRPPYFGASHLNRPTSRPDPKPKNNEPVQCEPGATGHFPHPHDCRKFLHCWDGRTFMKECGPGTAFNPSIGVCDHIHNVASCSNQKPGSQDDNVDIIPNEYRREQSPVEKTPVDSGEEEAKYNPKTNRYEPDKTKNNAKKGKNTQQYPDPDDNRKGTKKETGNSKDSAKGSKHPVRYDPKDDTAEDDDSIGKEENKNKKDPKKHPSYDQKKDDNDSEGSEEIPSSPNKFPEEDRKGKRPGQKGKDNQYGSKGEAIPPRKPKIIFDSYGNPIGVEYILPKGTPENTQGPQYSFPMNPSTSQNPGQNQPPIYPFFNPAYQNPSRNPLMPHQPLHRPHPHGPFPHPNGPFPNPAHHRHHPNHPFHYPHPHNPNHPFPSHNPFQPFPNQNPTQFGQPNFPQQVTDNDNFPQFPTGGSNPQTFPQQVTNNDNFPPFPTGGSNPQTFPTRYDTRPNAEKPFANTPYDSLNPQQGNIPNTNSKSPPPPQRNPSYPEFPSRTPPGMPTLPDGEPDYSKYPTKKQDLPSYNQQGFPQPNPLNSQTNPQRKDEEASVSNAGYPNPFQTYPSNPAYNPNSQPGTQQTSNNPFNRPGNNYPRNPYPANAENPSNQKGNNNPQQGQPGFNNAKNPFQTPKNQGYYPNQESEQPPKQPQKYPNRADPTPPNNNQNNPSNPGYYPNQDLGKPPKYPNSAHPNPSNNNQNNPSGNPYHTPSNPGYYPNQDLEKPPKYPNSAYPTPTTNNQNNPSGNPYYTPSNPGYYPNQDPNPNNPQGYPNQQNPVRPNYDFPNSNGKQPFNPSDLSYPSGYNPPVPPSRYKPAIPNDDKYNNPYDYTNTDANQSPNSHPYPFYQHNVTNPQWGNPKQQGPGSNTDPQQIANVNPKVPTYQFPDQTEDEQGQESVNLPGEDEMGQFYEPEPTVPPKSSKGSPKKYPGKNKDFPEFPGRKLEKPDPDIGVVLKRMLPFEDDVPQQNPNKNASELSKVKEGPPSGQNLRLRNGSSILDGYLEIRGPDGKWGLACDAAGEWNVQEASIICQELGFNRGAELSWQGYPTKAGAEKIHVSVDGVVCAGDSTGTFDENCKLTFTNKNDCQISQNAIGLRCYNNIASSCQPGEVPLANHCYKLHQPNSTDGTSMFEATQHCLDEGAHLLDLNTQSENDFISEYLLHNEPNITSVMTAGVGVTFMGMPMWIWQSTGAPMLFQKWWTGWLGERPLPQGKLNQPVCLVMKRKFPCPKSNNETRENLEGETGDMLEPPMGCLTDYFFWDVELCKDLGVQNIPYICERPMSDIGCVEGRGEAYSGIANTTSSGKACLPWDHPKAKQGLARMGQQRSGMQKTLQGHNYCRNIGNSDRHPWCFIEDSSNSEYCDIPHCENNGNTADPNTQIVFESD